MIFVVVFAVVVVGGCTAVGVIAGKSYLKHLREKPKKEELEAALEEIIDSSPNPKERQEATLMLQKMRDETDK